jgi:hypothetical protein
MGWFSSDKPKIEVKERSSWGTIKWVGKCPECGKEHSDDDKKKALKKIGWCLDRCIKKAEREAEREAEDEEDRLKRDLANKGRELRRLAKGKKCPFCKKNPCEGKKPKCTMVIADKWIHGTHIDVSDPAYFDDQLRWYKENME